MFLIDYIFIGIGSVLILSASLIYFFSNRFFDILSENALHIVFFAIGFAFLFATSFMPLFFNRCDVCQQYVQSDYCTDCGSYVASHCFCSCGSKIDINDKFCPSCGRDLDISNDF